MIIRKARYEWWRPHFASLVRQCRDRERRQVVGRGDGDALGGLAPADHRQADRPRRRVAAGGEHRVAPAPLDDKRRARRAGEPVCGRHDAPRHDLG